MKLTKPQSEIFHAFQKNRFCAVNAGRRFGKSYVALAIMLHAANTPNQTIFYIAPSHGQARALAFDPIRNMVSNAVVNKSRMTIQFPNGSIIRCTSSNNEDAIRGYGIDLCIIDEAAVIKNSDLWDFVIRPALSAQTPAGKCLFISTPRGRNWFYDIYNSPFCKSFQYTTIDGGNVSREEIASARENLERSVFAQEYLASFEVIAGRIYSDFSYTDHIKENQSRDNLLIGLDFNVAEMTAVVGSYDTTNEHLHIHKEITLKDSNTDKMSQYIRTLYPDERLHIYPDASGNSRKTSSSTTDFQILKSYGFHIHAPKANPLVTDRISTVNYNFQRNNISIDKSCKKLINALSGITYDKHGKPDKHSGLDHIVDALGYLTYGVLPISSPTKATTGHL